MTKPLPGVPGRTRRRSRRRADAARGLAAGLLLALIVGGAPVALLMVIGNPLPRVSGSNLFTARQSSDFVVKLIACVVWLAWVQLSSCLLVELVAGVRGTGLPWRVPFASSAQQDFARRLVAAMLLLATSSRGLHAAPLPSGPVTRASAVAAHAAGTTTATGATVAAGKARVERATGSTTVTDAASRTAVPVTSTKTCIVMPPDGQHHDSLWGVAERYLGSGTRYREIFQLNEGRLQPDGQRLTLESLIMPGWTLVLPADAHGAGLIEIGGAGPLAGAAAPAGVQSASTAPAAVGQPASITAPAPGSIGGRSTEVPERSPDIPWDLVGAELLAAGLLELLVALRRRRSIARYAGGPVAQPDDEATGVETAVRIGADPASARFIDGALRLLAHGLAADDRPVPEIYAARISADRLELLLAVPQQQAPAPFLVEDGGGRWALPRDVPLPPLGGVAAPLPGLVSVGGDGRGRVLVDLEAAGGVICVEGGRDAARSVVAAAAVELVTNPWSDEMNVTLVGFGDALAPLNPSRLRCVDTLAEVLEEVTGRLSEGRQELAVAGVDSVLTGRLRGIRGGPVTPEFVVLASPPPADELAELAAWARAGHGAPLGILVAGAVPAARWRFAVGEDGILGTGVLGLTVGAQQLSPRSYAALARLLRAEADATVAAERAAAARPATIGAGPADVTLLPVQPEAIAPALPRPVDPDAPAGVRVRIFGEPAAEGGESLAPGTPLAVEILSFLALAGPVTPRRLAAAVWPYGVTEAERDASLDRLQRWLGLDGAGAPRLRFVDGKLALSPDVQLDWHLFVALAQRDEEEALLRALELARGPLAEPHLPRRYSWLHRQPVARELPAYVVDVAHRLAQRYLVRRAFDGAVAAARAGLRVEPLSDLLWHDLVTAVRGRDGDTAAERVLAERATQLAA
ncbi:MAG: LysM peptidoglycan-binding domain-containing protein [Actinobacteria bacterium]|nr:LysM peptidoglycan-binding domain-containing protein [Actinomycetota bacterium]MBI3688030.1 LysM peptidoglycan-binding domain-containing protein [Actinomycetota bacterium]